MVEWTEVLRFPAPNTLVNAELRKRAASASTWDVCTKRQFPSASKRTLDHMGIVNGLPTHVGLVQVLPQSPSQCVGKGGFKL